jgi:hypothetical protein
MDMPQYKSHKTVCALKIKEIRYDASGGAVIIPQDPDYTHVEVSPGYMKKHAPAVGGYYVVYEDGYDSYSPAQAFEEGYTRLTPTPPATSAPSGMLAGGGADKVTDPPPGCGEATISAPPRPRPENLRAVVDQLRSGSLEHQHHAAFIITKGVEAVFHAATRAAMDRIHEEQRNINELVAGADKLAFTGVIKPDALDRLRAIEEHLGLIRKTIASFASDRRFRDLTIRDALTGAEKEQMERQAKRAESEVRVEVIPIELGDLGDMLKGAFPFDMGARRR